MFPQEGFPLEWAIANNVEFVPMISHKKVKLNTSGKYCMMTGGSKACSVDEMVQIIEDTRSMGLTMKYLLGHNEPWDEGHSAKWNSGKQAAEHFGKYLQPIAEATGLKLVSPSTSVGKYRWMASFLKECYMLRNDKENPCDVDKIKAFSVHDYQCNEKVWRDGYKRKGTFHKKLVRVLRKYGKATKGKDWDAYVAATPFWVTETNCNWEKGFSGDEPMDTATQCKAITG